MYERRHDPDGFQQGDRAISTVGLSNKITPSYFQVGRKPKSKICVNQYANTGLNSCQFCPNSANTVLAAGGQQMKMFSLDDYS